MTSHLIYNLPINVKKKKKIDNNRFILESEK